MNDKIQIKRKLADIEFNLARARNILKGSTGDTHEVEEALISLRREANKMNYTIELEDARLQRH